MVAMLMNHKNQWIGSVIALLAWSGAAHAEYKPAINSEDFPKEVVREGQDALKSLPFMVRDTLIAEHLGMLFTDSWDAGYWTEGPGWGQPRYGCRFVDRTGKMQLFFHTRDQAYGKGKMAERNRKSVEIAKTNMKQVADDVILMGISKDVTRVVLQTAKFHLRGMPSKLRDAELAYWGDMLYTSEGESGYTGETKSEGHIWGAHNVKQGMSWKEERADALFTDSKGRELSFREVRSQLRTKKSDYASKIVRWCANLVGAKDILAMFPKEVKAMRAAYEKKVKTSPEQAAEETEDQP